LNNNKGPGRKVKEIDNRGSSYYLSLYWAECLAKKDPSWNKLAQQLKENEETIAKELVECQGVSVDIGGYYKVDDSKASAAMRPCGTLNQIIDSY